MKIEIEWGLRNSPKPWRNTMIIKVDQHIPPSELAYKIGWSGYDIAKFPPAAPNPIWWGLIKPCKKCKEKYERRKNEITGMNIWWEAYCLRHAAIVSPLWNFYHLLELELVPPKDEFAGGFVERAEVTVASRKHEITAVIDPKKADVTIDNVTFTFKNHTNAYPLMSSYALLCKNVGDMLSELSNYISAEPEKRWCAVVIETPKRKFVLPAGKNLSEMKASVSNALSDC